MQPFVLADPGGIGPNVQGGNDVYLDGGILCNYPLHVFDGWWLSLKPEDTFVKKLCGNQKKCNHAISNKFGGRNDNTIGFCLQGVRCSFYAIGFCARILLIKAGVSP
jgi:hypothetical protein